MLASVSEHDTLLDAATTLIPLSQGKLDNLCGLYAVLNAIQLASWPVLERHHYRSRPLFNQGLAFLDNEGLLCSTLTGGMGETTWHELAETLVEAASTMSGIKLTIVPMLEDGAKVSKSQFVALMLSLDFARFLSARRWQKAQAASSPA